MPGCPPTIQEAVPFLSLALVSGFRHLTFCSVTARPPRGSFRDGRSRSLAAVPVLEGFAVDVAVLAFLAFIINLSM